MNAHTIFLLQVALSLSISTTLLVAMEQELGAEQTQQSDLMVGSDSPTMSEDATCIEDPLYEIEELLSTEESEVTSMAQRLSHLETQAATSARTLDRILQLLETQNQATAGPLSPAAPKLHAPEQANSSHQRIPSLIETRTFSPQDLLIRGLQHYWARGVPGNYNAARWFFEKAEKQTLNKKVQAAAAFWLGEIYLRGQVFRSTLMKLVNILSSRHIKTLVRLLRPVHGPG